MTSLTSRLWWLLMSTLMVGLSMLGCEDKDERATGGSGENVVVNLGMFKADAMVSTPAPDAGPTPVADAAPPEQDAAPLPDMMIPDMAPVRDLDCFAFRSCLGACSRIDQGCLASCQARATEEALSLSNAYRACANESDCRTDACWIESCREPIMACINDGRVSGELECGPAYECAMDCADPSCENECVNRTTNEAFLELLRGRSCLEENRCDSFTDCAPCEDPMIDCYASTDPFIGITPSGDDRCGELSTCISQAAEEEDPVRARRTCAEEASPRAFDLYNAQSDCYAESRDENGRIFRGYCPDEVLACDMHDRNNYGNKSCGDVVRCISTRNPDPEEFPCAAAFGVCSGAACLDYASRSAYAKYQRLYFCWEINGCLRDALRGRFCAACSDELQACNR